MTRDEAVGQAEQVRDHLDLARAAGTGADANGGYPQALCYRRGKLGRDELEDDREGACLLDGEGVGQQPPR